MTGQGTSLSFCFCLTSWQIFLKYYTCHPCRGVTGMLIWQVYHTLKTSRLLTTNKDTFPESHMLALITQSSGICLTLHCGK